MCGMKEKRIRAYTRSHRDFLFPLERGRKVAHCVAAAGRCGKTDWKRINIQTLKATDWKNVYPTGRQSFPIVRD